MTAARAYAALADLREEAARCRALWCAVLTRVLLDADRSDRDGEAARAWLASPDALLLELAGIDTEPAARALGAGYGGGCGLQGRAALNRSDRQISTDAK